MQDPVFICDEFLITMNTRKHILAISGSTRAASSNLNLINAIAQLAAGTFDITIYDSIARLPIFNPDIDNEKDVPAVVTDFRAQLKAADGVLICTPEYAMGVPGALKNAIDWTVSSSDFSHKPVALITASTSGLKAHDSLMGTLAVIEAKMNDDTQFVISFIKTKVNTANTIADEAILEKVNKMIIALSELINTGS
jgi:NAD(P)H-dependent FMN reductase